jgi:hypothetical protein
LKEKKQNRTPFWSKIRPIKPMVGKGRSEAKPPISPSSELDVSSGSEEETGEGEME